MTLILRAALLAAAAFSTAANAADPFVTSGQAALGLSAQNSIRQAIHNHTLGVKTENRADGGKLWLDTDFAQNKTDSLLAGHGYKNRFYMAALGADVKLNDSLFGVVYNWGQGSSQTRGEALQRKGDTDFFGIKIYGLHSFGALSFTGSLGYMRARGNADITPGARRNTNADYTSADIGAFVTFPITDTVTLQPYANIQATYLHPDGNRSAGDTDRATLLQAPVGLRVASTMKWGQWTLLPSADLSVISSFGDTQLSVRLPAGENSKLDWTNKTLYRTTIGLVVEHEKGSLGINYSYTGADDGRSNNALRLTGRYVF